MRTFTWREWGKHKLGADIRAKSPIQYFLNTRLQNYICSGFRYYLKSRNFYVLIKFTKIFFLFILSSMSWLHMTEWSLVPLIFNRDIKYEYQWLSAYPSRFLVKKTPVTLNTRLITFQKIPNQFGKYKNLFPLQTIEPHLLVSPTRSLRSTVRFWLRFISEWYVSMFKLEGGNDGWHCVGSDKATQSSKTFYLLLILFILRFSFLPVLFIDPYSWKSFVVSFIALVLQRLR